MALHLVILRAVATVLLVIALVVLAVHDLDAASKWAGIIACVLAVPSIWWSRPRSTARDHLPRQSITWTRGRNVSQRSGRPAEQRIERTWADGDITQQQ